MFNLEKRGLLIVLLVITLLPLATSYEPGYYSDNVILPPDAGEFLIDISSLTESQLKTVMNSLTELQVTGEVGEFYKSDKNIVVDLQNQKEVKIEVNNRGILITKSSLGYIIEFKKPPLLEKDRILKEEISIKRYTTTSKKVTETLSDYKKQLESEHRVALSDINRILNQEELATLGPLKALIEFLKALFNITGRAVSASQPKNGEEFYNVFNGVVLDISREEALKIKKSNYVKKVHPNKEIKLVLFDSVPQINADDVWQLDASGNNCSASGNPCLTGEGMKIAIIDSGIDYTHPDLGGCFGPGCKVEGGYDFINYDSDPMDDQGHGTHCAGIAAGDGNTNNGSMIGIKGVAPKAKLYAYKVISKYGTGTSSSIIAGIDRAVDPNNDGDFSDKVDVISLSLGGWGYPDDAESMAVDNAVNNDVVVVVAAGNDGPAPETIDSPGCAREALTVGAINKYDKVASFSGRGPVIWGEETFIKPDIVAPGVRICSAWHEQMWSNLNCFDSMHIAVSGTSMATPHVAGAAALVRQAKPSLSAKEIKSLIETSAEDLGYDFNAQGSGKIDLLKILSPRLLFSESEIDFGSVASGSVSKTINIKNQGVESLLIYFSAENATNAQTGLSYDIVSFTEDSVVIPAGSNYNLRITLTFPQDVSGTFSGKIMISDKYGEYSIPYSASILTSLTLKVEGNHFPHFYIYESNHQHLAVMKQGADFIGNEHSFSIAPGNYNVYVINDFSSEDETDEYILVDTVSVPVGSSITKTFRLSDARLFTVKTESKQGTPLEIFEWTKGLIVYPQGSTAENPIFRVSFLSKNLKNTNIYISDNPSNNLNADILLKYLGASTLLETFDARKTGSELYAGGWILHNVDSSTPTTLQPDYNAAIYNFSYNLPGGSPKSYLSQLFFIHPFQDFIGAPLVSVAYPLTQSIYAYVNNPVSGNYNKNFSLARVVELNYIGHANQCVQFAYDSSGKEIISDNVWDSLNPELKEKKEFSFGGPYNLGSVMVENNTVKIRREILSGKGIVVRKQTEMNASCCTYGNGIQTCTNVIGGLEKPKYQMYEDGIKVAEENLTTNGLWDKEKLLHSVSENKDYAVYLTIPNYYSIFNLMKITSIFSTNQADRNPPWIENLEISSRFKDGETLILEFTARDDNSIADVKAFYSEDGPWKPISLYSNGNNFFGAIVPYGEKIDLDIELIDSSGNLQDYRIYPVSLKTQNLTITLLPVIGILSLGNIVSFTGYIKNSQGNGVSNLLIEGFLDKAHIGNQASDNNGFFNFTYRIPISYFGQMNFSVSISPTGTYKGVSSLPEANVTHDVAVLELITPISPQIGMQHIINATVTNLGNFQEVVTIIFREDGIEIKRVGIMLNPSELSEQQFNFTGKPNNHTYEVEALISNDQALSDNKKIASIYLQPSVNNIDVSISDLNVSLSVIVNRATSIFVSLINLGIDVANVNLSVYDDNQLIATKIINSLSSGAGNTENFLWTPATTGNHTIKAEAVLSGDMNPTDNSIQKIIYVESSEFKGNSTNLTTAPDIVWNFTLERTSYGKIIFKEEVNISRFKKNPLLLQDYVSIIPRIISLDTNNLAELTNKSAELLFRNIDMHNPQIHYNGAGCPSSICTFELFDKNAKTFKVDITKFSEFEILEGIYCGDNICQSGETCADCSDCYCSSGYSCVDGVCEADDTGDDDGGNGGGGGQVTCTPNWDCKWGPCENMVQRQTCTDLNKCGTTSGRPSAHGDTRTCFIDSQCVDNDGDGYGVGPDCLGPDIDDNNPDITDTSDSFETPGETASRFKDFLYKYKNYLIISLIFLILLLAIIITGVILSRNFSKKIKPTKKTEIVVSESKKDEWAEKWGRGV